MDTRRRSAKRPKQRLLLIALIGLGLAYLLYRLLTPVPKPYPIDSFLLADVSSTEVERADGTLDPAEHMPVYLTGAVQLPGLYWVPVDSILDDLVQAAGGLKEDAACEVINLAMRVKAHQLIHLPTREELAKDPQAASLVQPLPGTPDVLVNLNSADAKLLMTLPGIGPATADAIVKYREKNGLFLTPEDIMNIPGIKRSRFEAIEDYVTVE